MDVRARNLLDCPYTSADVPNGPLSRRQHRFESGWGRQIYQQYRGLADRTSHKFVRKLLTHIRGLRWTMAGASTATRPSVVVRRRCDSPADCRLSAQLCRLARQRRKCCRAPLVLKCGPTLFGYGNCNGVDATVVSAGAMHDHVYQSQTVEILKTLQTGEARFDPGTRDQFKRQQHDGPCT